MQVEPPPFIANPAVIASFSAVIGQFSAVIARQKREARLQQRRRAIQSTLAVVDHRKAAAYWMPRMRGA